MTAPGLHQVCPENTESLPPVPRPVWQCRASLFRRTTRATPLGIPSDFARADLPSYTLEGSQPRDWDASQRWWGCLGVWTVSMDDAFAISPREHRGWSP